MKRVRVLSLTLILVTGLMLSSCSSVLPGAVASLSGLGRSLIGAGPRSQVVATTLVPVDEAPRVVPDADAIDDLQTALQEVYQENSASVVNIRVTMEAQIRGLQGVPGFPSLPGQQFPFGQGTPDTVVPQAYAEGSGFVWDLQGHIVTNNHVVDGATDIKVTFSDGVSLPARLVGADPDSDLAVISVDPSKVELRPIGVGDSTQVTPGLLVVAIGNPFGLEGSMSFGIVSAVGRSLPSSGSTSLDSASASRYTIPDIIQTDAPVNPGNSGGVLLDLAGNLIGVPTAIESAVQSSAGVGFAVPAVIVKKVVPMLIEEGVFAHPYIGISGGTITSELATAMGLPQNQRGALVVTVTSGGPADEAGLRGSSEQVEIGGEQVEVGGDVITAINDQPVEDFEDLIAYLARKGTVGQKVELTVLRDGESERLTLTLGERPTGRSAAATSGGRQQSPQGGAWLGISGVDLTAELAKAMDLPEKQVGALIQVVTSGSPADQAGLRGSFKSFLTEAGQQVMIGGDIITEVDSEAVDTMQELATEIGNREPGEEVTLDVLRDGSSSTISVTLASRPTTLSR